MDVPATSVLNIFYYVWHQQEAPLRAKDVTPLSLYKGSQQDIRLLSEGGRAAKEKSGPQRIESQCLYLGGFARQEMVVVLGERLAQMDIKAQPSLEGSPAAGSGAYCTEASVCWGMRSAKPC